MYSIDPHVYLLQVSTKNFRQEFVGPLVMDIVPPTSIQRFRK